MATENKLLVKEYERMEGRIEEGFQTGSDGRHKIVIRDGKRLKMRQYKTDIYNLSKSDAVLDANIPDKSYKGDASPATAMEYTKFVKKITGDDWSITVAGKADKVKYHAEHLIDPSKKLPDFIKFVNNKR